MKELNVNVFSDDAQFCSALAIECNKYGFDLSFFEKNNVKTLIESKDISVVIIDLTSDKLINPYKLGKLIHISSDIPVFGILDDLVRQNQIKAKECGFDLVFTKSILLRSIKEIVVHISNK